MAAWGRTKRAFPNLDKAWKAFPRVEGSLRILVFNKQGQPVIQYSRSGGASTTIDERECALGMELARTVFSSILNFRGGDPARIAFFFDDEVITIERADPFILLVFLPSHAARMNSSIDDYLYRLILTLQEELT